MTGGVPEVLRTLARSARRPVVLTGAGMSAESGVPTFRDAQTGLWERFDAASLASPDAWNTDPAVVWAWYQWRAGLVRRAQPNAGHRALAEWGERTDLRIVTQNVDDLHERAGSVVAAHLHGSLFEPRCSVCGTPAGPIEPLTEPVERLDPPPCARCGGPIRPGAVWFGEPMPTGPLDVAFDCARTCDLMLVIGTSGVVHPAAGLPVLARESGATVVEINPDPTGISHAVDHVWRTTAGIGLPALLTD
ncbi:NAD-dependent deacylase [Aldersonia sp. NBC_00410]|uniref:SIR2 family NAD-dependent protein deacylase n=1 Tax=Aldersonia sp. NBC_00410 TaxID=2975954 RepID=UPI0022523443|nr:NAD-dependent deacylase [Aldersonia sp. NBC_00410]MCX5043632.1 NAD-dependent deacylase [Aldersonia sp. NBC_00410]